MEYKKLGATDLNVSVIGFGGIPIQRVSSEEAIELFNVAKENGINFIDTARGYTNSEVKIGLAIKSVNNNWVIASKSMARDREAFLNELETSLTNLGLESIDLYQFHNIGSEEDYDKIMSPDGAYKAALEAQKSGKIRYIGMSTHKPDIAMRAVKSDKFVSIQVPFNAVEDQFLPAIELANKNNIGVIVMKPLAGGAITNASSALKYILDYPVTVVIPGMQKVSEIIENAKVGDKSRVFSEQERKELNLFANNLGSKFCRRCEYCLPCPEGIKIPFNFILHGYLTRYNLKEWAINRYYSQEINASACVECGVCETRCPYELPIREMLKEVSEDFEPYEEMEE
jgi:predicted aldo/keto reductase-like oxidoreductase